MADLKSGANAPHRARRPCCAAWPVPSPRIRWPSHSSQRQKPCWPRLGPQVVPGFLPAEEERVRHRCVCVGGVAGGGGDSRGGSHCGRKGSVLTLTSDLAWLQVSATFAASLVISPAIGAYLGRVYGDSLVVVLATAIALLDICFILVAVPESLPEKMRPASWGAPISWEQADPFAASSPPSLLLGRVRA